MLTAQEAERTRLARELHDDITQQLAALSLALQPASSVDCRRGLLRRSRRVARLQQQTISLSEVIRHLSHELHPGVLQHAGLVEQVPAQSGVKQAISG